MVRAPRNLPEEERRELASADAVDIIVSFVTIQKPPITLPVVVAAVFVLLVVIPAAVSLLSNKGAVCLKDCDW